MFERFTERARQVVVLAQEEARMLNHEHIGTEHMLLGLLREEEGVAARVLQGLGVTAERVRADIVRIAGMGAQGSAGQVPFTPHAKQVLELSLREALGLGHDHIGTQHLLLGLLRVDEGLAARVLRDCGASADRIRGEVIRTLGGPGASGPTRDDAREEALAALPEPASLSSEELREMVRELTDEEQRISRSRRVVHAKIDILREEFVKRLRSEEPPAA